MIRQYLRSEQTNLYPRETVGAIDNGTGDPLSGGAVRMEALNTNFIDQ